MLKIKSIFGKYIGTFFFITLLSFALLTTTITAIVDSYGTNILKESLENAALSAVDLIKTESGSESLSNFVKREKKDIATAMKLLASNDDTLLIMITDPEGTILHYGGAYNARLENETVTAPTHSPSDIIGIL